METLLTPWGLLAVCTAIVAVVLFGFAPRLPSVFPPAFTRFVGFATVCASLAPLWAISGEVVLPAVIGGLCLAAMVAIHVFQAGQTRGQEKPKPAEIDKNAKVEVKRYV